jgi:hypothetical protein
VPKARGLFYSGAQRWMCLLIWMRGSIYWGSFVGFVFVVGLILFINSCMHQAGVDKKCTESGEYERVLAVARRRLLGSLLAVERSW